jgi:hypothetical protein
MFEFRKMKLYRNAEEATPPGDVVTGGNTGGASVPPSGSSATPPATPVTTPVTTPATPVVTQPTVIIVPNNSVAPGYAVTPSTGAVIPAEPAPSFGGGGGGGGGGGMPSDPGAGESASEPAPTKKRNTLLYLLLGAGAIYFALNYKKFVK